MTHSNCVGWGVKKDKIVLVVPPFSSSVPPPRCLFSWNSPEYKNWKNLLCWQTVPKHVFVKKCLESTYFSSRNNLMQTTYSKDCTSPAKKGRYATRSTVSWKPTWETFFLKYGLPKCVDLGSCQQWKHKKENKLKRRNIICVGFGGKNTQYALSCQY